MFFFGSLSHSLTSSAQATSVAIRRKAVVGVINTCWLVGLPIAIVVAAVMGCMGYLAPPTDSEHRILPQYGTALAIYIASALFEMCGEPLYILGTMLMWVRLRVMIELAAVLCRTVVTALLVLYFNQDLLAFSIAQVPAIEIFSSFCLSRDY
jgi:hypothetical protein